jgi:AcrR family transcriptional regulator
MVRKLSAEKRSSLLKAALKLFVEKGIQSTSTAEIAQAAGTAAGTLFIYFPTKQDLVDELALNVSKELSDHINSRLDPSLSARDSFLVVWKEVLHWFLADMEAYQYAQQIRVPGVLSPAIVMETGKYFSFYYQAIQKGLDEDCIKPYPIDLIGGFLYHDFVAVMNYIQMLPDAGRQEEAIQRGFELFWDGIRKQEDGNQGKQ